MKRVSRGAIFWGAALITMGIVILLIQQGYVDDQLLANAGQWWPLLLIGVGVAVIFAGVLGSVATALAGVLLGVMAGALISGATSIPVSCGNEATAVQAYQDGSFDQSSADVTVDLSCVTFDVAGGPGSDWAVQADEQSTHDMTVTSDSDSLDLHTDAGVVFEGRRHVALTVPEDKGTNLEVSLNAGEATFDLADGQWGELNLTGKRLRGHRRPRRRGAGFAGCIAERGVHVHPAVEGQPHRFSRHYGQRGISRGLRPRRGGGPPGHLRQRHRDGPQPRRTGVHPGRRPVAESRAMTICGYEDRDRLQRERCVVQRESGGRLLMNTSGCIGPSGTGESGASRPGPQSTSTSTRPSRVCCGSCSPSSRGAGS